MNKRAVYTFWTKPEQKASYAWASPQMMLNSWIASVENARNHFGEIVLRTDEAGKRMLVNELGLEFDEVVIAFEGLDETRYPWTTCKLMSYRDEAKRGPATHLDFDLFLTRVEDKSIFDAPLFCQNIEPEVVSTSHYADDELLSMKAVPEWYWTWRKKSRAALNCGILGWNDCEFMLFYAETALRFLEANAGAKWGVNAIVPEQAFLGAAVFEKKTAVRTFYNDWNDFYRNDRGITHLIGMRKSATGNEMALNAMTRTKWPSAWARAQEIGYMMAKNRQQEAMNVQ